MRDNRMNLLEILDVIVDLLQDDTDLGLVKTDVVDIIIGMITTVVDEKIVIAMKTDIEMIIENHEEDEDLEAEAQVMNNKETIYVCYLACMKCR